MNNFNPYYILGVNKNCSQNDIKRAFRHLAKKYHPDKKISNSDKFIRIQTAYEMLMGTQSLKEQTMLSHNELKKNFQEYNVESPVKKATDEFKNINIESRYAKPTRRDDINKEPNTLKDNLEHLQDTIFSYNMKNNINESRHNISNSDNITRDSNIIRNSPNKINFDTISDNPINKNDFGKVVQEYMKKRNIKSITNIFNNSFDLSIFNQIYVDLKKKSSKELIIKDPIAYNSNSLIKFSELNDDSSSKEDYKNVFRNNVENPEDITIKNKYKKNDEFIRDDILGENYYSDIKKRINAYNNNSFS